MHFKRARLAVRTSSFPMKHRVACAPDLFMEKRRVSTRGIRSKLGIAKCR